MKSKTIFGIGLVLTAAISSTVTIITLTSMAANENPIALRLGLNPYKPTCIDVRLISGTVAERFTFLTRCEPDHGIAGYPTTLGVLDIAKSASLDELSTISPDYFGTKQQPITTCLMKVAVIRLIAERVNKGETIEPSNREALAKLLDHAAGIANAVNNAVASEQLWSIGTRPSGSRSSVDWTIESAYSAANKLREVRS